MDILGLGLPITKTSYFEGALPTPDSVGGEQLRYWFDVTDSSTVASKNLGKAVVINSLKNKSTNLPYTLHFASAVSGFTPVYKTDGSGQNGLDYSEHNGGGQSYTITDSLGTTVAVDHGDEYTFYVVQDNDAASGVSGIAGGRSPNAFAFRWSGANLIQTAYNSSGTGNDSINPAGTAEENFGVASFTVSDAANEVSARFNGEFNTPGVISGTVVPTSNSFFIGKSNITTQYYTGKIYEFMLFTKVLNETELGQLDLYVQNKYNFSFA
jgi:hypothetical protein